MLVGGCGATDDGTGSSAEERSSTVAAGNGEQLDHLRIHHPSTLAFSAPFAVMAQQNTSLDGADEVTYETWDSPDVLRSLLANGDTSIAATPSYVGANMYNKGVKVRMAAVTVWGLIHLLGPEGASTDWESLRGKEIAVPLKGDMPDLVFQWLLEKNGLDPAKDVSLSYYASGSEIAAKVVAGSVQYAVLPEHAASVAVSKAKKAGHPVAPLMDLQSEWAEITGQPQPRLPQAGVVVYGDLPGAALQALDDSIKAVNEHDDQALAAASKASQVPQPMVDKVIDRLNLEYVPAKQAQPELERFYEELSSLNPAIIGGKLPDDAFYLDDLR